MTEFLIANMAPIMFVSLIVFLMFGYAVSFSLAACGLFFGFVGVELGVIQATCIGRHFLRDESVDHQGHGLNDVVSH